MSNEFRLLMLGAMYENGGNTTHRFLDGHPEMFVYPFESQIGTRLVNDPLTSMFPVKYRWPVFALDATPVQDYKAIIDEEGKVRARTPHVSKFRHMPFDFSDDARCERYQELVARSGRSTAGNVAAFFQAMSGRIIAGRAARACMLATARSSPWTPSGSWMPCRTPISCMSCATRSRPMPTQGSARCR